jgi:hypothetical protein
MSLTKQEKLTLCLSSEHHHPPSSPFYCLVVLLPSFLTPLLQSQELACTLPWAYPAAFPLWVKFQLPVFRITNQLIEGEGVWSDKVQASFHLPINDSSTFCPFLLMCLPSLQSLQCPARIIPDHQEISLFLALITIDFEA